MAHPKDRPGLTRGQLLKGAAGSALAVGGVGALAGCENTTTPIGGGGGVNSKFVEARPLGPGGLPLPAPGLRDHVGDHERQPADRRGRTPERGPLKLYNYADYLWPGLVKRFEKKYGTKVEIATYNSADEAIAKLAAGAVTLRRRSSGSPARTSSA